MREKDSLRRRRRRRRHLLLACALLGATLGCAADARRDDAPVARVLVASSLERPLRAPLDSFARAEGMRLEWESGASLELARRVTDLGRTPELLLLADAELIPRLLVPAHAAWHARFAAARLVLAWRAGTPPVDSTNWAHRLAAPGVEVARADPGRAPVGYRTLLAWRLAALHGGDSALVPRLLAHAPARAMRPTEAEVVALVQGGEADYGWLYETTARNAGLAYARLSSRIDFSAPAESSSYRAATLTVRAPGGDSLLVRGAPASYGLTVIAGADSALGARLAAWILSPAGRRALRAAGLEPLEPPLVYLDAPAAVREAAVAR